VVEGRVDDSVGRRGSTAHAIQVVHVAAEDLSAGTGQRLCPRVRARKPNYPVPRLDELWNQIGTDETGGSRHEDSHVAPPTSPTTKNRRDDPPRKDAIAIAIDQPEDVDVGDIVVRPTAQS
jgi:hypothetical protein